MSGNDGNNNQPFLIRVSTKRSNFAYVDSLKGRFSKGLPEASVSALGEAISDAVAIVEILKNQGLVKVKKIKTSRYMPDPGVGGVKCRIEILIEKSEAFDSIYAEQQKRKLENVGTNEEGEKDHKQAHAPGGQYSSTAKSSGQICVTLETTRRTSTMAVGDAERPKNSVRVSVHGSKFLYADITKHLLHDGEEEVCVSALCGAINGAVSVVEMLKDQQMVVVKKITTSRQVNSEYNTSVDKIEIVVSKANGFDEKYKEQQKAREANKLSKANEGNESVAA